MTGGHAVCLTKAWSREEKLSPRASGLGTMDLGQLGLQMNYNTLNEHSGTTREGSLNRMEKSQVQRDAGTCLGHRAGQ